MDIPTLISSPNSNIKLIGNYMGEKLKTAQYYNNTYINNNVIYFRWYGVCSFGVQWFSSDKVYDFQ